ncbi:MAG: isoprenylcysteine carboxylmethyltransferase family protein, partial [Gaiellales bacterium]
MQLLLHDPVATCLVVAAVGAMLLGEVGATYLGLARDGERHLLRSLGESLLATRRRDGAAPQDRWTKWIIVLSSRVAILAAFAIAALAPGLRAYANDWWTLGLGVAVVLVGVALRAWAIVSLGRYFRREVTIEPGQRLVRRGPYRLLRHPSYTGILLSIGGLGLAAGSWVGAAVAVLITFAGMLPRIRVEERALAEAFGAEYV